MSLSSSHTLCSNCGVSLTALTQFSHGICMDCAHDSVLKAKSIRREIDAENINHDKAKINDTSRLSAMAKRLKDAFSLLPTGMPRELFEMPAPLKAETKKPEVARDGSFEPGTKVKLSPEFFYYGTEAPTTFVDKVVNRFGFRAKDEFEIVEVIDPDGDPMIHITNSAGQFLKGLSRECIVWVKK